MCLGLPPGFKSKEKERSFQSLEKLTERRSLGLSSEDLSEGARNSTTNDTQSTPGGGAGGHEGFSEEDDTSALSVLEKWAPTRRISGEDSVAVRHEEDDETSALSVREGWAVTKKVDEEDDDDDDEGEVDSPCVERLPAVAITTTPSDGGQNVGSLPMASSGVARTPVSAADILRRTKSNGEDEDDDDDDDFEDGDEDERQKRLEEEVGKLRGDLDDDNTVESSEYNLIRVNTETDLGMENPFMVYSTPTRDQNHHHHHQNRTPENGTVESWGIQKRPDSKASPKKVEPSASLRVQHSDVWLNQFILPPVADEAKAAQLEAIGGSRRSLTPAKDSKEVSQLRYSVEQSHAAVEALEQQLEEDLRAAKLIMSDLDFLKLVSRCLTLKKQALVACVQAAQRGMQNPK